VLRRGRPDRGSYGGPIKDRPNVTESAFLHDTNFYKKHVNQVCTELKPDLSLLCLPVSNLVQTVLTSASHSINFTIISIMQPFSEITDTRQPLYVITKYSDPPNPVAARSKAWVCGRSLAGIVGSNPAGGMEVCVCLLYKDSSMEQK
jgi:hypothetical protein